VTSNIHKGERGIAALLEDLRRFLSGGRAGTEA